MKIPQPFQYQGSKRALAGTIMRYLPENTKRIVEPFAGSAAFSIACAAHGRAQEFWLNDYNQPLARLLNFIINKPDELANSYQSLWKNSDDQALGHYYSVRENFNETQDPQLLLYLLARCVKGSVRYNSEGAFNQSADKRRLGTRPETMRDNVMGIAALLNGRTAITSLDYRNVLQACGSSDIIYMDPPYQGVCREKDSRYLTGISYRDFVAALDELNSRNIRYLISYDGRLGSRKYGQPLPDSLKLTCIEIEAGRSSQATLLGRKEVTVESLYISRSLASEIEIFSQDHSSPGSQTQLFETVCYG